MPASKLPGQAHGFANEIYYRPCIEEITNTDGYPSEKNTLNGRELRIKPGAIPLFNFIRKKGKYSDKEYKNQEDNKSSVFSDHTSLVAGNLNQISINNQNPYFAGN